MPPAAKTRPSTPPAKPPAARGRSYVVLRQTDTDPTGWRVIGTVIAVNDQAAIKRVVDADDYPDTRSGTFVAVPARSFKTRTRKIKTVEKDEWS